MAKSRNLKCTLQWSSASMNHWPLKISRTEGSADFRTHSCMTQRSQFWIILCPIHDYAQWNTLCTLTQHLLLIHAHGTYKSIIINWRATAFYIDWVIQKFSLWMLIRFLWKMFTFYGTNGWPKPNKLSGLYLYIETDHHCLSLWTEISQFAKIHISEN